MEVEAHRTGAGQAEITVGVTLDTNALPFETKGNRSLDNVTFTLAMFDSDGKYISGNQQKMDLKLKASTLAALRKSGLKFHAHTFVRNGSYTVRVVAWEAQNGEMAAVSRPVTVPN